jgi:hypothetical protein
MFTRVLLAAAALALAPAFASATTATSVGNQTSIFYDNVHSGVVLGDFNLATEPVGITALFTAQDVAGSIEFGVFSNPAVYGAGGSLNVNIIADNESFSGLFDGVPLVFVPVGGDFVATFETTFAGALDVKSFVLNFSGFDQGDQFQVNVSSVIPLPASVFLLLGALGGLGVISRHRKAAIG